ncbi:MAG: Integral rane sensor signal transduction histidine kinase [Symbiobacteriaceae bacterium]|jgi:signal transduction histidine kinase|nr:Integral rane sensor signal transduction histidine kinase [Symbiobacteriaceae bacterium]
MMKRHGRRRSSVSLRTRLSWSFSFVTCVAVVAIYEAVRLGLLRREENGLVTLLALVLCLLVGAHAGVFTGRIVTRHLTRLTDFVKQLDLKGLSARAPVEGDAEVAALAQAFNSMLDRMEASERVRRELFAEVAHELRHPLAVLKGRLDMMQDGVESLTPEQVLRLQDQVISLTRLVGDLRDLSLADVGQLPLNLAPFDLSGLVQDLRANMEPVAADREIQLRTELAPDMPQLMADSGRVRQVLLNLLDNALQHTPAGGRVDLRVWAEGARAMVRVSDTGPGIAPEDLPHIFDRFYRSRSGARAVGGSGLGLAIVRSLVVLHGGTIEAESTPGQGSRFTVTLPLAPGAE